MNTRFPEPILHQPISELELSAEFKAVCAELIFENLAELLQVSTRQLVKYPGFTLHLLYEYVNFLEARNLGHYVDRGK